MVRIGGAGGPGALLTIRAAYVETTYARLKIGGATPGTGHDQLVITNLARLAGTPEVTLTNGFTPPPRHCHNSLGL